ncbi:MAG: DUF1549 domain-containing protein [Planctomycetaceae bacterium]
MLRAAWTGAVVTAALLTGLPPISAQAQDATADADVVPSSVVELINTQLRQGWEDNQIKPSPQAEDAEWLRRAYLDIVGHIPPAEAVTSFVADRNPRKRAQMIETLLEDPGYVRNWTTIWTNLCIGRSTPDRVSRDGMRKFFREAFAKDRPWDEIVYDLISAEGRFEENGAVNYLLAQMTMNDDAVQATAHSTRLFLGIQVQCTQCHNHPFNEWKQDQFWQFNSFFRQARRVDHQRYDAQSGRMVEDYSELVRRDFTGPVYFEKRNALMQVAYPEYFGHEVDPGADVDRRNELARLMTTTVPEGASVPLVATAIVNRMWGHFLGYGFTRPVDDMGPHNPPSHPVLLEELSQAFVESGYDLKQLVRWITSSEAYHLTSRFGKDNTIDNPAAGETPLFSKVYVKNMTAEQLYDSLIIATQAHKSGRSSWDEAERQRQEWLQQFVIAFDTDENDEATTFNGTIPQALMMMNGELVQNATSGQPGSFLRGVLEDRSSDVEKIQMLYLSTLSRLPTRSEQAATLRMHRMTRDKLAFYQDLFWALLNSNEFIFNH